MLNQPINATAGSSNGPVAPNAQPPTGTWPPGAEKYINKQLEKFLSENPGSWQLFENIFDRAQKGEAYKNMLCALDNFKKKASYKNMFKSAKMVLEKMKLDDILDDLIKKGDEELALDDDHLGINPVELPVLTTILCRYVRDRFHQHNVQEMFFPQISTKTKVDVEVLKEWFKESRKLLNVKRPLDYKKTRTFNRQNPYVRGEPVKRRQAKQEPKQFTADEIIVMEQHFANWTDSNYPRMTRKIVKALGLKDNDSKWVGDWLVERKKQEKSSTLQDRPSEEDEDSEEEEDDDQFDLEMDQQNQPGPSEPSGSLTGKRARLEDEEPDYYQPPSPKKSRREGPGEAAQDFGNMNGDVEDLDQSEIVGTGQIALVDEPDSHQDVPVPEKIVDKLRNMVLSKHTEFAAKVYDGLDHLLRKSDEAKIFFTEIVNILCGIFDEFHRARSVEKLDQVGLSFVKESGFLIRTVQQQPPTDREEPKTPSNPELDGMVFNKLKDHFSNDASVKFFKIIVEVLDMLGTNEERETMCKLFGLDVDVIRKWVDGRAVQTTIVKKKVADAPKEALAGIVKEEPLEAPQEVPTAQENLNAPVKEEGNLENFPRMMQEHKVPNLLQL